MNSLTAKQRDTIATLRENLSDVLKVGDKDQSSDLNLQKWLHARKWDLIKAEEMFRKSVAYKKQLKLDEIDQWTPPEVLTKYYPGGMVGFDKEGYPLWIEPFSGIDAKGISSSTKFSDIIKYKFQLTEKNRKVLKEQSEKLGKPVDLFNVIVDLDGVFSNQMSKEFLINYGKTLAAIEENYPGGLKYSFMIRAPSIFSIGYSLMKPFMSEDTKSKTKILGKDWKEVLLQHFDADQLPEHYGGTQRDPDGNPKCETKINYGGTIPTSYYLYEKKFTAENTQSLTISSNSNHHLVYKFTEPNSVLQWEFQSSVNIGFGVYMKTVGEEEKQPIKEMKQVAPLEKIKANVVESGFCLCENPGTYVVQFDNSASWISSAKVTYAIETLKSEDMLQETDGEEGVEDIKLSE